MSDCHSHISSIDLLGLGELGLLLTVLLTGLTGSFTHCIGMCGPLAMMQANMRMMNIPYDKMNKSSKLKAAFTLPYYIGKGISYSVILLITLFFTTGFGAMECWNYISATLMIIASASFVYMGITNSFKIKTGIGSDTGFKNFIINLIAKLKLDGFGIRGVILGFVLGFVPCAFVYAMIVYIIASTQNIYIQLFAVQLFALSTVPGLFVSSYFGNAVLVNLKKYSSIIFRCLALINGGLLFGYALKVL